MLVTILFFAVSYFSFGRFALSIFCYKTCPETNANTFFEEMFKSLVRMQKVVAAAESKL